MGTDPSQQERLAERGPNLHLDLLEELFGKAYSRWAPSAERRRASTTRGQHAEAAARFAELEVPLGAVAGTFAGRHVALRPAELSGGSLAGVLLLPSQVALSEDARQNRDLFFVRAAIAGAGVGQELAGEQEPGTLARAVATACELAAEHPGFAERVAASARLELGSRPRPDELPPHEQPLELLRQAALLQLASCDSEPAGDGFACALARYRGMDADATRAPERSFWNRLMRSRAPSDVGPGPLLLLGGPLTPTDRDDALGTAAALAEGGVADDALEHEAPVRDHVRETTLEEDPYKENMPSHSFEKVDFADSHDGGFRKVDGHDDMDEQAESLEGVDLREMIRGGPEVQSIYKAEIGDVGEIPDVMNVQPQERGVTNHEWDEKRKLYRRDWVTLYPTRIDQRSPEFGAALSRDLKATTRHAIGALEVRRTERIRRTRQLDGDEVDLDGVVEEYAERLRGGAPPGRLYVRSPRLERDVATSLLLDLSLSADSWVQDQRVLDVELAAACVLGEVAEAFEDQLQILAFASNTRNLCRTWTVKDWHEPWSTGRARLGTLKPQGYTRIGPAVRHATAQLEAHPAKRKHLLLVTDGKPTDFDRYEGGHGIHDVAWAVREARRAQVSVHALGLDPRAASILPTMFGPGGWRVLRHIADLPAALVRAYD
ncbi:MAG: VWA domain-containing protein [Planctomycetota bacterium]|nr:VWA domain-containing protein [Planctomycetota bacterium]